MFGLSAKTPIFRGQRDEVELAKETGKKCPVREKT